MIDTKHTSKSATERRALWRRIRRMYDWFNRALPEKCYSLLDPKLADRKVQLPMYCDSLRGFKEVYGSIRLFHIRIRLHLDASTNKHDPRPFAYVYVTWKDEEHAFHMFKERWVKHAGKWYTRVVGLVPNKQNAA
jgi:hypothetical protein